MNKKWIIILLIVAVLGIALWWFTRKRFAVQWLPDGKLRITYKDSSTDVDPVGPTYYNAKDTSGVIAVNTVLNNKLYIVVYRGDNSKVIANTTYDLTTKKFT